MCGLGLVDRYSLLDAAAALAMGWRDLNVVRWSVRVLVLLAQRAQPPTLPGHVTVGIATAPCKVAGAGAAWIRSDELEVEQRQIEAIVDDYRP